MRQVLKRQTLIKYINIYQILKHSSETPFFLDIIYIEFLIVSYEFPLGSSNIIENSSSNKWKQQFWSHKGYQYWAPAVRILKVANSASQLPL